MSVENISRGDMCAAGAGWAASLTRESIEESRNFSVDGRARLPHNHNAEKKKVLERCM